MEEEFLESDIIFAEYPPRINEEIRFSSKRRKLIDDGCPGKIQGKLSFPVTIPAGSFVDESAADEEGDEVLVPPHLIIGRRVITARKMAFSVCTGNGRTLKGRDLSQVRNMILRMTGFLETRNVRNKSTEQFSGLPYLFDLFMVPNGIGAVLGVIQLGLYYYYYSKREGQGHSLV